MYPHRSCAENYRLDRVFCLFLNLLETEFCFTFPFSTHPLLKLHCSFIIQWSPYSPSATFSFSWFFEFALLHP